MSAVEVLELIAFAVSKIRGIVDDPVTAAAADVANAIAGIFKAVDSASAGHVTPDQAKEQIASMTAALKGNDDAADAALASKFAT